jgi:O-6-methylguanine DNA methyltransferase
MAIFTSSLSTPIGELIAGATDEGICLLDFKYRKLFPAIQRRIAAGLNDRFEEGMHPLLEQLHLELDEYFAGSRREFSVAIRPVGSAFQQKIWMALGRIPYGRVATYLQQAKIYGDEKAIRAVATANGMNGIAIIIPCHRVIGTNGSLTGYGGGLAAKRWLLNHERSHAGGDVQPSLFR